MSDVDRIEEDVNLALMMRRVFSDDKRNSHVAKLVSIVLNLAGAEVTQEEVFYGMYDQDDESVDSDAVDKMLLEILDACFFKSKKKTTQAGKKKSRISTRGKASTS